MPRSRARGSRCGFTNDALWIGLYPGMGADRLDYMAATIREFFAGNAK